MVQELVDQLETICGDVNVFGLFADCQVRSFWNVHLCEESSSCALNVTGLDFEFRNGDIQVVGINTFKLSAATNVSFAIPIDTAMRVINQLLVKKRVIRPQLGFTIAAFSVAGANRLADIAKMYPDVDHGIVVKDVKRGSPAQKAGIQRGDLIVEFDGYSVSKAKDILDHVGDEIGREIQIRVRRQNVKRPISMVLKTVEAPFPP